MGLTLSHKPFKSGFLDQREKPEIWSGPEGVNLPLKIEGLCGRQCGRPQEAESSPQLTVGRAMGTWMLQLQETEFCQRQEWAWKWIFPGSPDENSVQKIPWFQSCDTLSRGSSHAVKDCWPTELWVNEWVYCFKLLNLLLFVTQQQNSNAGKKVQSWLSLSLVAKHMEKNISSTHQRAKFLQPQTVLDVPKQSNKTVNVFSKYLLSFRWYFRIYV